MTDTAVFGPEQLDQPRVIEPRQQGLRARLAEFWRARRLLRFFGRRTLDKSYARTKLGWSWILLRPILDTGTRVLIFGGVLKAPSSGSVPYLVFFMFGMAIWTLFGRTMYWATRSIDLNRRMVSKIYFPRLVLPFGCAWPGIVEFFVYCGLLAIVLGFYVVTDHTFYLQMSPKLLASAGGLLMALALAFGVGLFTSVLGATARDVRFSLNYVLNFWFLVTPVLYPLDAIPDKYRPFAELNPMTSIVELMKWGTFGGGQVRPMGLFYSAAVIGAVWIGGLTFFHHAEARSVDRL